MESRPYPLIPGEPAPWFRGKAIGGRDDYVFDTAAGRYILMLFFASAADEKAAAALACLDRHRQILDDVHACFFGVTADPDDEASGRVGQRIPGIRFFLDPERRISGLYGADKAPHWLLLDPMLRALGTVPMEDGEKAFKLLAALASRPPQQDWAPVLMAPNILEPELCRRLIAEYEERGGEPSGFMREVDGKTRLITDPEHKLRRDCAIENAELCAALQARVRLKLAPAIKRAFQFEATRMERYIVGCYEAGAGHFRPHRDNTTAGTAHRRFAVTINLNAGDYEGGDLRFPEFGARTYRAPTGGAVVFSCSLLHEATPVKRGRRYAFLPFLYDEAAARLREANNPHLGEEIGGYSAGPSVAGDEPQLS